MYGETSHFFLETFDPINDERSSGRMERFAVYISDLTHLRSADGTTVLNCIADHRQRIVADLIVGNRDQLRLSTVLRRDEQMIPVVVGESNGLH